jgi:hypothetical protein
MRLTELMELFKAEGFNAVHLWADYEKLPMVVFYETGENYEFADDGIAETVQTFNADYYTKNDADPNKERIKELLSEAGIVFSYKVLYNQEKRFIVHSFNCEMY